MDFNGWVLIFGCVLDGFFLFLDGERVVEVKSGYGERVGSFWKVFSERG